MSDAVKVGFVPLSTAPRGVVVVFCDEALKFGSVTRKALGAASDTVERAAAVNQFKGKSGSILDIPAPEGIKIQRLLVVGTGKGAGLKETDFLKFGGSIAAKLNAASEHVTILAELPGVDVTAAEAASIAAGLRLRAYKFTRYKTKKKEGDDGVLRAQVSIAVGDADAARKAWSGQGHIVDGVIMARELVNEPPNVLYPEEFARRASQLKKLGVDVEVLDVKAMTKLGMGALLGVAQGSARPGRTVIMRWNGGKRSDQPVGGFENRAPQTLACHPHLPRKPVDPAGHPRQKSGHHGQQARFRRHRQDDVKTVLAERRDQRAQTTEILARRNLARQRHRQAGDR